MSRTYGADNEDDALVDELGITYQDMPLFKNPKWSKTRSRLSKKDKPPLKHIPQRELTSLPRYNSHWREVSSRRTSFDYEQKG